MDTRPGTISPPGAQGSTLSFKLAAVAACIGLFVVARQLCFAIPAIPHDWLFAAMALPAGYALALYRRRQAAAVGTDERFNIELISLLFVLMPAIVISTELAPAWHNWIFAGFLGAFMLVGEWRRTRIDAWLRAR
jgi:hypothetical protein